jgi:DNA polymerase III delta subunit
MPVYLLLGDDEESKARGVKKLRKGRAVEAYDAAETNPETVVSACNSRSLFGDGPFVSSETSTPGKPARRPGSWTTYRTPRPKPT